MSFLYWRGPHILTGTLTRGRNKGYVRKRPAETARPDPALK